MAGTTSEMMELPAVTTGDVPVVSGRGRWFGRQWQPLPFFAVVICAILFALPIYWLIVTSLKAVDEVFADPLVWWPRQLVWSNYPQALQKFPFLRYLTNTITIAIIECFYVQFVNDGIFIPENILCDTHRSFLLPVNRRIRAVAL